MAEKFSLSFYAVLEPRYWMGRVTEAKIARVTQNRPQSPQGPVIKLKLTVPSAIFEPYIVDTEVEIDEGRIVPIVVEQQYEIERSESGNEAETG